MKLFTVAKCVVVFVLFLLPVRGGDVKLGAGCEVILSPATIYTKHIFDLQERLNEYLSEFINSERFSPLVNRIRLCYVLIMHAEIDINNFIREIESLSGFSEKFPVSKIFNHLNSIYKYIQDIENVQKNYRLTEQYYIDMSMLEFLITQIREIGLESMNPNQMDTKRLLFKKTTIADANGNFEFSDLPPGEYVLACTITWLASSGKTTGGLVTQKVTIADGENKKVMLTR